VHIELKRGGLKKSMGLPRGTSAGRGCVDEVGVPRRRCHRNAIWLWGFPSVGLESGSGGRSPRLERFISEDAERAAGYEMALNVES
jgi:hypothetical protein